jgi:hypothetical protein
MASIEGRAAEVKRKIDDAVSACRGMSPGGCGSRECRGKKSRGALVAQIRGEGDERWAI